MEVVPLLADVPLPHTWEWGRADPLHSKHSIIWAGKGRVNSSQAQVSLPLSWDLLSIRTCQLQSYLAAVIALSEKRVAGNLSP